MSAEAELTRGALAATAASRHEAASSGRRCRTILHGQLGQLSVARLSCTGGQIQARTARSGLTDVRLPASGHGDRLRTTRRCGAAISGANAAAGLPNWCVGRLGADGDPDTAGTTQSRLKNPSNVSV